MVSPVLRLQRLPISFYATGAVLALSLGLPLPQHGSIAGMPSICPFFNITGTPCPGCGLTRSFVSLAHGHIREAFAWHPLGPIMFTGALLYLVGTALGWKWPKEQLVLGTLFVLMLMFWGLRLSGVFPMPPG